MIEEVIEEKEPVTFAQRMGVAANASDLTVRETDGGPADALIGLGMALAGVARNPGKRPELAKIEAQLIPTLWRVKSGDQAGYRNQAAGLFADWMIEKGRFTREHRLLALVFAARLIHEWIHEICSRCGGAGVLERVSRAWVRPVGNLARNPRFSICSLCHGSRRSPPKHAERAKLFCIPMRWYESNDWGRRFNLGLASLDGMMGRLDRRLAKRFRRV